MAKLSAAIPFLIVAIAARADWKMISTQTEPPTGHGIEHRYLVFEDSSNGDRASLELAIFSTKFCRLRMIDQPDERRLALSEVMQRENCLAGVNGGYFDPDGNPVGLLVANGQTLSPLRRARLLSGVLFSVAGKVQIARFSDFSTKQKIDAALECGPMVVDMGKPVHGLESTRPARRTFAAVASADRAALGFCSDVTLADLALILGSQFATDFKIQRALNLDGGSSSAFWFRRKDGSAFSIAEEKTVRDFVAVVPK
ncbi:MAG TPA: phosphodiester glycosidase family protein [Chthoniobacterales bacterium]|nr:phosphodiester glycosidase family protein [Chthoniobacterales bacterium]